MAETVATRREMVRYDKRYRFSITPGMNAYAYSEGVLHDIDDEHSICANDIPAKGLIRKKEFYLVEISKEIDLVFPCGKFGMSEGILVRMRPETSARSISLILMKYGKTRTEGNESIISCDTDDLFDMLQESFEEAVDNTSGDTEEEFLTALVDNMNKTGEFLDYNFGVFSASKYQ